MQYDNNKVSRNIDFIRNTDSNLICGGDYNIPEELYFPDNGDPEESCLSVFVVAQNLNDTRRTQLINCIASIKLQTFLNLDICIINLDTDIYARRVIQKIASDMHTSTIMSDGRNPATVLNYAIKEVNSKYVTFIDATDVIPRIRDVENAMYQLYNNNLDFLTFTVKYQDENGREFDMEDPMRLSTLCVSPNLHFSAYFKRETLLSYKFDYKTPFALDKRMINCFEYSGKKGAHILGKTPMTILGPIMQIKNYAPVPAIEEDCV